MPPAEIRAFRDRNGGVPLQEWLDDLEEREPKAYAKCLARITELAEKGYEMRRPHADSLRDGIRELRATVSRVHYRMLYFFYGKNVVAVSHGITKEGRVPPEDIDLAIDRMSLVKSDPELYTADFEM